MAFLAQLDQNDKDANMTTDKLFTTKISLTVNQKYCRQKLRFFPCYQRYALVKCEN